MPGLWLFVSSVAITICRSLERWRLADQKSASASAVRRDRHRTLVEINFTSSQRCDHRLNRLDRHHPTTSSSTFSSFVFVIKFSLQNTNLRTPIEVYEWVSILSRLYALFMRLQRGSRTDALPRSRLTRSRRHSRNKYVGNGRHEFRRIADWFSAASEPGLFGGCGGGSGWIRNTKVYENIVLAVSTCTQKNNVLPDTCW